MMCSSGAGFSRTIVGGHSRRRHGRRIPHRSTDAHQPRLRVVHRRRRQPQRRGRRLATASSGDRDWKRALPLLAPAGRADLQRRAARRRLAQHVRRQHPRSRAGYAHTRRSSSLSDPDGVPRRAREDGRRSGPAPSRCRATGGRTSSTSIRPASPDRKIEPAFDGLMCAYNLTCAGTDWATAGRPRVAARRHDPGPRRRLQVQPLRVHRTTPRSTAPCRSTAPTT